VQRDTDACALVAARQFNRDVCTILVKRRLGAAIADQEPPTVVPDRPHPAESTADTTPCRARKQSARNGATLAGQNGVSRET